MVAPLLCLMGIGEKEMLEGLREQHAGEQQNDATLPADDPAGEAPVALLHRRSEEHTSELQSLMRISYAVFCLKKKNHEHYQGNHRGISTNESANDLQEH